MRLVGRSMLNNNYRQPARLADMAAAQHGGQKGDLLVQHVDDDCMEGRETRYTNVHIAVDVRKEVYRILTQDVAPTVIQSKIQDLTNDVTHQYLLALAEELSNVCQGLEIRQQKTDFYHPDVLVLAPRCSDDPEFLTRLEDGCVARDSNVAIMVKNGQVRFGSVAEWTGSQCPLVFLTGFHQPQHLLNNVGCIGPARILTASRTDAARAQFLAKTAERNTEQAAIQVVAKAKEREEIHNDLRRRISQVPVDTLLYIAITRATWGIVVVEPNARKFVQHYVVGKEGRSRSRAGETVTVKSSLNTGMDERVLHKSQFLLEKAKEKQSTNLNMSRKDLSLVPNSVLSMRETQHLDLSVNNLQQLPGELWTLPLTEINLSHNPGLGPVILPILQGASSCTSLKILRLQDVGIKRTKLRSLVNIQFCSLLHESFSSA